MSIKKNKAEEVAASIKKVEKKLLKIAAEVFVYVLGRLCSISHERAQSPSLRCPPVVSRLAAPLLSLCCLALDLVVLAVFVDARPFTL